MVGEFSRKNMWRAFVPFLSLLLEGGPAECLESLEKLNVNISYATLGNLYVDSTMCHIKSQFHLGDFLETIRESENLIDELEPWLAKV